MTVCTERKTFVFSGIFLAEKSLRDFQWILGEEVSRNSVRSQVGFSRATRTRLTPRRHAAPVPGNLKLVIIHQDKPRTDSLVLGAGGTFERRYTGAAANEKEKRGGEGGLGGFSLQSFLYGNHRMPGCLSCSSGKEEEGGTSCLAQ
ncbi:hypothetical protein K0M31_009633 [Melipona bicolor]|uniref:Uncharacterized protein n=1 Tax=Melipona bicolor TaxID=60889 RepID=A0AA40FPF2_9HYME|nr:hypothetical protein K0M31_009633 [Melipona bicolor]